ncbi:MAG: transcription antitermination factor NusB, partial [Muribaculaceae bacterium]|nr:transcription antitermination factor NusB [Muribaculaceae bacterium]
TAVMRNKDTYRSLIRDAVKHTSWTDDRLAFMDVVIIMTALGEILNFPKIPISVSVNEYVEMAKVYSTHRSDKFVNGVLGAIIDRLQNEGFLDK